VERSKTSSVGVVPGGLFSVVANALSELDIEYTVSDKRPPVPTAYIDNVGSLREGQDKALLAIATKKQGIISTPTAFGKSYLIAQLTLMYPQLHILVTTKAKTVVAELYKRVEALDKNVSRCDGAHGFDEGSDIVVSTTGSLHKIDPDWPDMLLFDEVHEAASDRVRDLLLTFQSCRMFGFSATPEGRGDGADMEVQGLFGDVIYTETYKKSADKGNITPLEVRMVHVYGSDITVQGDIEKARRTYWRNAVRNREIARQASAYPASTQVLIYVDKVEHVFALKKLLPQYEAVYSSLSKKKYADFIKEGLISEDIPYPYISSVNTVDKAQEFSSGKIKKAICTSVWSTGVDFVNLAVMIRADGGAGSIPNVQIPGRLSRKAADKDKGVLIDFFDHFGRTSLQRSNSRLTTYKEQGWKIIEINSGGL